MADSEVDSVIDSAVDSVFDSEVDLVIDSVVNSMIVDSVANLKAEWTPRCIQFCCTQNCSFDELTDNWQINRRQTW